MRKFSRQLRFKESATKDFLNVRIEKHMKALRWLQRKSRRWYKRLDSKCMKSYVASYKPWMSEKYQ